MASMTGTIIDRLTYSFGLRFRGAVELTSRLRAFIARITLDCDAWYYARSKAFQNDHALIQLSDIVCRF
jgi:hypothetical protein